MNKDTFTWSISFIIAVLYLFFGVPMIYSVGLGEVTPWGLAFGVVLGLTPLLGLIASNTSDVTARKGIALILGVANLLSALLASFGWFFLFKYSPPAGTEGIFGTAMLVVALAAFTVNTVMCFRILVNGTFSGIKDA